MAVQIKGIDVSKWQADKSGNTKVDFSLLKRSGYEFVILRASIGRSKDISFESHYKAAKAAGLHIGAYHYLNAKTRDEALAEADFFLKTINGRQLDYPICLDIESDVQKKLGMAIIMVTHDLGVIASMCDEILVMYGGRVCERGTADDIFYRPAHEYTKGLLRSIPKADNMNEKLVPIGGTPINLLQMPAGCAFCPRCDAAMKICLSEKPEELRISDTHLASCWMNIKELYEAQEEAE